MGIWRHGLDWMDAREDYKQARFVVDWLAAHEEYDSYVRKQARLYARTRDMLLHLCRHRIPYLTSELTKLTFLVGTGTDFTTYQPYTAMHAQYRGDHWQTLAELPPAAVVKHVMDGKSLSHATMDIVVASMVPLDVTPCLLELDVDDVFQRLLLVCMELPRALRERLQWAGCPVISTGAMRVPMILSDVDKIPASERTVVAVRSVEDEGSLDSDFVTFGELREAAEREGKAQPGGSLQSVLRAARSTHASTRSALLYAWIVRHSLLRAKHARVQQALLDELEHVCDRINEFLLARARYREAKVWAPFFPGKPDGLRRLAMQRMHRLLYADKQRCDRYLEHLWNVQRPRFDAEYHAAIAAYQHSGVPTLGAVTIFEREPPNEWEDGSASESEQVQAIDGMFGRADMLALGKRPRDDTPRSGTVSMTGLRVDCEERVSMPVVRPRMDVTYTVTDVDGMDEESAFAVRMKMLPFECMVRVAQWL